MGLRVAQDQFEEADFDRFDERLRENLAALRALLDRPGFGEGDPSLGAELEMSLVDRQGRPRFINEDVLRGLSRSFTVELDRFNIEYNCGVYPAAGKPFSALETELRRAIDAATAECRAHDAEVALIGILPSLRLDDLGTAAMTDMARYRALSAGLRRQRNDPFRLRIDGIDPLEAEAADVTVEGAATSLQIHLRARPRDFARVHNAVQLATGPGLAFAGNSPTFLGHRLWDETRIALFKQAVDGRSESDRPPRVARVSFGTDWVHESAYELFEESVRLHSPLLPVLGTEDDPVGAVRAGQIPELAELRLHHGTVWRWNRAIYDSSAGGHLRIELRALPSGPTLTDMLANAAFVVGLALDLARDASDWVHVLPFRSVEHNFYRAAQLGPEASLLFIGPDGETKTEAAGFWAPLLIDRARRGLRDVGIEDAEIDRYLPVFAARAELGRTGARWQRRRLAELGYRLGAWETLSRMFDEYRARSAEGAPVHTWGEVT